jgi:hypothetical protein
MIISGWNADISILLHKLNFVESIMNSVFYSINSLSPVKVNKYFAGTYLVFLKDRRLSKENFINRFILSVSCKAFY